MSSLTGAYAFQNALFYLDQVGIRDVLLPFFLIFTIVFAVMQRVKVFDQKKYNTIIAAAIALMTVWPHVTGSYPNGFDVVVAINQILPEVALLIIVIVLVIILIGLSYGKNFEAGKFSGLLSGLAVAGLLLIFWRAFYPAYTPVWLSFLDDPGFQSLLIILIVFGLIVNWVTSDTPAPGTPPRPSSLEWLTDFMRPGSGGGK